MKKILLSLLFSFILSSTASAGSGTIQVKDQGGTPRTFDVVTDSLGNFVQTSVVCDGTAAAQCAAVKAASTAAVAADPALVIGFSPNSPLPAGVNSIGSVTANQGGAPWAFNHTQLAGSVLGAPSNYGTSPGAVLVPGVNAFITNSPTVTANQGGAPWSFNHTQLAGSTLGAPSNYGTSPGAVSVPGVNAFVTNTVVTQGLLGGTPTPITIAGALTTGGATMYHLAGGSAASNNSTSIISGIHSLKSLSLLNTQATTIGYFRLYDNSGAPTCSSTTNAQPSIPVLPGPGGIAVQIPPEGWKFSNGISFCITGGGGDSDNTNAPTGIFVIGSYQ